MVKLLATYRSSRAVESSHLQDRFFKRRSFLDGKDFFIRTMRHDLFRPVGRRDNSLCSGAARISGNEGDVGQARHSSPRVADFRAELLAHGAVVRRCWLSFHVGDYYLLPLCESTIGLAYRDCGVSAGRPIVKHTGFLVFPMLYCSQSAELVRQRIAAKGTAKIAATGRRALKFTACCCITASGWRAVGVLWIPLSGAPKRTATESSLTGMHRR